MTRNFTITIGFLFCCLFTKAQKTDSLTIEQCFLLAVNNSPLSQQKTLTITAGNLTEKNLSLKWLPQLDVNAQATYQSAVTSLPIKLPNVAIEELDKDQYKATLDLVQPIFDGGIIAGQKRLQKITTETEIQRVEIDLYQLKSKVSAYYFTALLMNENIEIMRLVKQDLQNVLKKVAAQVTYGTATKSNEDMLNAELLKTEQREIEYFSTRKAAIQMLQIVTGIAIDENTSIIKPAENTDIKNPAINRPELKLFDYQRQTISLQSNLIKARVNPKFSLFADGGYGKPGLNLLKNEFQWFYLTGVKVNIPIMGRITQQKDRDVLKVQEQIILKQKDNFLKNNQQLLIQQKNEIDKYRQLMATDNTIVFLRRRIKENALVKLSNGIITSSDYITELNAENQAMLGQKLHEVQLFQAQYNYKIISGQ